MPSSKRIGRSLAAVLAGLVAVVALSIFTDLLMHSIGALPEFGEPMGHGHAALALGYRIVYGIVGGYVAARLAPQAPVRHAIWLGIIGLLIGVAGALATWGKGPQFGPGWYAIAVFVIAIPTAWYGGRLLESSRRA